VKVKLTGAQYLARTLEGYGVTHFFHVPAIIPWTLAQMEETGRITRVVTHDERAAGYMADGYARASGRPGVCGCQMIGTNNLAAGLRDAFMARSPVLAFSGGSYVRSRHRHQYQEIDGLPVFAPVTKFNVQVDDVTRLPDLLRQGFRAATSGKPGPVHLALEGHFGEETELQEAELDDLVEERFAGVPPFRPLPQAEQVTAAVRLLVEAERPVLVAGGGVRQSGAGSELLALAELLSIPVATSLNAKDVVPGDHPLALGVPGLYQRESANRALLEADLVCYVGSQTGSQVTRNWTIPLPGTRVVQIDVDPEELGRHYPNTVSVLGDAKLTLGQMVEAVEAPVQRPAWTARATELVAAWRASVDEHVTSDAAPMRPERLLGELGRVLPPDSIVVADTGHAGFWTGTYLDLTRPGQGFLRAAGSLGWGFPAALGAKMAVGDERSVVLFTGDGGLWYHLAEIETALRWGVKVVVVVNDNHSMNEQIPFYEPMYGGRLHGRHEDLWVFREVDFAAVATSLGAIGRRVERPRDFAPALEQALEADRLTVLDVLTDIEAECPWGA
jgi:acetolactate synthase-1/2/3 large subunit